MKLVIFSMALVSLLSGFNTRGQTPDSVTYHVVFSSTGNFTRSNDQRSYLFNNIAKANRDGRNLFWQGSAGWIYSEQSGVKVNNDFTAVLESDVLRKRQKLYYWGLLAFDKSYSLKIDHRLQMGAGLGYTLAEGGKGLLVVSDGIIYERSQLTDSELGYLDYDVWRNSLRIKYRWLPSAVVTLEGSAFLQPSLSRWWDDTVIRSATTLSVRIKKWLSLTTSCTYNRLTLTDRENLIITYGVTIDQIF
jgi:hypothetical protein